MLRTTKLLGAALGILLGTAACNDESLIQPATTPVDALFTRYVSMGNSITAGFQSGGINDSTQLQSYAILLARQMGTTFYAPLMNRPGCPPPYKNVFTGERIDSLVPCALRQTGAVPPPYINNVAVPGAAVIDPLSNLSPGSRPNALTTFFLGGLSQTQMMQRVDPTFASLWIGNNDVLGAALDGTNPGDVTKITDTATFHAAYTAILDSLTQTSVQGAVLIGTVRVTAAPFWSFGQVYLAAKGGGLLPPAFSVDASCAPSALGGKGDSVLIPMPVGGRLLAAAGAGVPATLYCFDTTYTSGPATFAIRVIAPAELAALNNATTAFNAIIQGEASAKNWAYWDPNVLLDSLLGVAGAIRPLPAFGAPCSASPFGSALSCDGIHPSASTHRLAANDLIAVINTRYGTTLAPVP